MLAILFIAMCIFFGYELVSFLVPDARRLFLAIAPSKKVLMNVPDAAFYLPAGAITGISIVTTFVYYVSLGFSHVLTKHQTPLLAGLALSSALFLYLSFLFLGLNRKNSKLNNKASSKIPSFNNSIPNLVYYGISVVMLVSISAFLFFYSFRITNGILHNGFSVFSDLSPHTAMTSSFGVSSNFPTQYIHFSGDGIQYHFFFYFFCGILEYLGLPLDYAINVPSIIAMVCAFCLLGLLAVLFSGRRMTYLIAPFLVLFRSSVNVYDSIRSSLNFGYDFPKAISVLMHSTTWFDQSPYDNWGIWAINVYANQRHLMFGVSMLLILIILFIPYVRRMCISIASGKENVFKTFFITRNSWIPRKNDPIHPVKSLILALILVAIMPYIHGSALIAALLVLFVMAIVSENRLSYLAVAVVSVGFSYLQTRIFSGNFTEFVKFSYKPGFVIGPTTTGNLFHYIFYITGLTLVLGLVFAIGWLIKDIVTHNPVYRTLLFIAFLAPMAFAFTFQVSLEMLANHKFIQITLILVDIFVSIVISNLIVLPIKASRKEVILPTLLPLDNDAVEVQMNTKGVLGEKKKGLRLPLPAFIPTQILSVIVAICLLIGLFGTGIAEWCTYINMNRNSIDVNTNSEMVNWINTHTDEHDVFLTPMWFTNRFYLSGRATYFGWPYYAWSAGHDTDKREKIYYWLCSGCNGNLDEFVRYCKEREIKYLVMDPEFFELTNAQGIHVFNAEFFALNLKQVAYFPNDNNTIIYQIY